MTLRNPRKYQQIFAAGIPSAANTNVNACHPRRASIAGRAALFQRYITVLAGISRQCRPGSVGNAGVAMLAQQCWPGTAGSAMLPRQSGPARLANNSGQALMASGNAGPTNAGLAMLAYQCWPGNCSKGNAGQALLPPAMLAHSWPGRLGLHCT